MPNPVTIRGITYPSMAAAARTFGLNPGTVFKAKEEGRLDHCGLGQNKAQPVTIDGVEYPSIQQAARATGINFETLRKRALK